MGHFDPELKNKIKTKKKNIQWKHSGSPSPKKFKRVPSAKKMMASIVWDRQGIIMITILSKVVQ
jgi:hypothetical protein